MDRPRFNKRNYMRRLPEPPTPEVPNQDNLFTATDAPFFAGAPLPDMFALFQPNDAVTRDQVEGMFRASLPPGADIEHVNVHNGVAVADIAVPADVIPLRHISFDVAQHTHSFSSLTDFAATTRHTIHHEGAQVECAYVPGGINITITKNGEVTRHRIDIPA